MIVQVAPTTIISPPRMKIEKLIFRSPKSQRLIGSTNQATSSEPGAGVDGAVVTPEQAQDRHQAEDHERDAEAERRSRPSRSTPGTTSSAPSTSPAIAEEPAPAALPFSSGGSGRLRIAVTMFIRLTRQAENATTASVSSTPIA